MMTPDIVAITLFSLVAFSIGGVMLALFLPQVSAGNRMRQRRELALGMQGDSAHAGTGKSAGDIRKAQRSVENLIREIEQKGKIRNRWQSRTSLTRRLRQAGLAWSLRYYAGVCVVIGVVVTAVLWFGLGASEVASVAIGLAVGLWLPRAYVQRKIAQRRLAFTASFPDAVDIIVRGVRSGIPVSDCLRIIASDSQEPVRSEFGATNDDLAMGMAVEDAVQRMSDRVELEEVRFFSIVITIQSRTGGNLSEALGNLSTVLRDRAKMRGRIRAMSSEAKASAAIIGSLPPIVCFLVFLTSPEYVGLLFSTVQGNAVLVASGLWMFCGIGIMRKMINFDF